MLFRRHRGLVLLGLGFLLIPVLGFAFSVGAVRIPFSEIRESIFGLISKTGVPQPHDAVLFYLRIPRVLLAALIGAMLALTGAMMQGLFRNPLADPVLVGVSGGAAFGAVFVIVLGDRLQVVHWMGDARMLPIAALLGALAVTVTIHRLATVGGYTSVPTLLLAGVALNALASAGIGFCTYLATDAQLRSLTFWMMGSLGAASWKVLGALVPFALILFFFAPRLARALNALALGEAEAGHLGFNLQRVKIILMIAISLGVGSCVAHTGMIGFVGLVIPHLVRLLLGPDHRVLLPGSAILGAILLVLADAASRTAVAPAELPIGIVTAAAGAPFFLWLLWKQRKRVLL